MLALLIVVGAGAKAVTEPVDDDARNTAKANLGSFILCTKPLVRIASGMSALSICLCERFAN